MSKRRYHAEPRKWWTATEDALLRAKYPHIKTAKLVPMLPGRSLTTIYQRAQTLGLAKTAAYLASPDACRLRRDSSVGAPYRFKKGQQSWNKGKRGYMGANRTSFKKGNRSLRWPAEDYPIGALRINSDGQLDIKFREGLRAWYSLARWTWQTERGPIPKGMLIRHRNGDQHDTRIENLELVTRAEHLRRNWHDRYPLAIKRMVQLRGALQRQINKREGKREQHNQRPA